jgi:hypothetical protein
MKEVLEGLEKIHSKMVKKASHVVPGVALSASLQYEQVHAIPSRDKSNTQLLADAAAPIADVPVELGYEIVRGSQIGLGSEAYEVAPSSDALEPTRTEYFDLANLP